MCEISPAARDFRLPPKGFGIFSGFLHHPRRARQHTAGPGINIYQIDAVVGEDKFSDLIRMVSCRAL